MMSEIPVADNLKEGFVDAVREVSEAHGKLALVVMREQIVDVCRFLKDDPGLRYNLLMDMGGGGLSRARAAF